MFTNNYKKYLIYAMGGDPSISALIAQDGSTDYLQSSNFCRHYTQQIYNTEGEIPTRTGFMHLRIGSGTDIPNQNDIKLSSKIIIENSNQRFYNIHNFEGPNHLFGNAFTNKTSKSITITELGIEGNNFKFILYARKLLDKPVIVQPGEIYTFQYALDFNTIQ